MVYTLSRVGRIVAAALRDDSGQDLMEYALLSAIIGVSGVLIIPLIVPKMADNYIDWNTNVQNAWEPCNPGGCP